MSQAEADAEGWRGTDEGGKMKEAGTTHWIPPNTGATNESGFSALPGGYRYNDGNFNNMGRYVIFWASTEYGAYDAWGRGLDCDHSAIILFQTIFDSAILIPPMQENTCGSMEEGSK
jgi:uncharacterized protein (TIGR02145 family)